MKINIAKLIAENNGELPHHTTVGGYPLFYITKDNKVLCPDCANAVIQGTNDDFENIEADDIEEYEINWDNYDLMCENDHLIESATLEVDED